ncbi:MAG: polyphenol oxidase family protein [Mesorhizobium sp.]|nr:MAG: polyphenol oxidase family protein [Mesorhizobium sp.]
MLNQTRPDPVRSPLLERAQGIRHGYFTRIGGVSGGIFQGLNIGTGSSDDQTLVAENRRRVADWMGVPADHLLTAHQVHSPDVVIAREPFAIPGRSVTMASALGRKGAFTGVLENTIAAMEGLGARRGRIVAVLGPSIGPDNYEVGPEFVARFVEADAGNQRYFRPSASPGHSMFDLNRYTVDRLLSAGVTAEGLGRCTYAEKDLFYSYRRTTHRKEADYGRQVSAIVLEKE